MKKKYILPIGLATVALSVGLMNSQPLATVFAQTVTQQQTGQMKDMSRRGMPEMFKNVERKVENITDGVKITMTSTDAATVIQLQSMKHPAPKKDAKVTVNQSNISNGIEITMTSTDAETVKKIQSGNK